MRLILSSTVVAAIAFTPAVAARWVGTAAIVGLDHVPIAVNDLDAAAAQYRAFGFALKPGRPHDNGIRNQHVKFPDGTELELITAPSARDDLTTTYRRHLEHGDGPAFLAFYVPVMESLTRRFDTDGITYRRYGSDVDFPRESELAYVFFGGRNQSPTDRPEHFAHANTATSLIAVWLAGDDLSHERKMLQQGGARLAERRVHVPEPIAASVARLTEGDVLLLPGSRQVVPGRRIAGATVRVRSLAAARRALGTIRSRGAVDTAASIFLPPALTHGLWLELREGRQ